MKILKRCLNQFHFIVVLSVCFSNVIFDILGAKIWVYQVKLIIQLVQLLICTARLVIIAIIASIINKSIIACVLGSLDGLRRLRRRSTRSARRVAGRIRVWVQAGIRRVVACCCRHVSIAATTTTRTCT